MHVWQAGSNLVILVGWRVERGQVSPKVIQAVLESVHGRCSHHVIWQAVPWIRHTIGKVVAPEIEAVLTCKQCIISAGSQSVDHPPLVGCKNSHRRIVLSDGISSCWLLLVFSVPKTSAVSSAVFKFSLFFQKYSFLGAVRVQVSEYIKYWLTTFPHVRGKKHWNQHQNTFSEPANILIALRHHRSSVTSFRTMT